jgi:hypothetical protein
MKSDPSHHLDLKIDQAWAVSARSSFRAMGSSSTNSDKNNVEQEDWIDRPSKSLRKPRGRPPSHPSPTAALTPWEDASRKRTWKRKNVHCSPSELREQHLHRNRVAASKYRQKHKTWTNTLAEKCRAETERRTHLQDLTKALKEEVLYLKEEAIHQSGCDCIIMKLYLERQTVNLFGFSGGSPMSPLATISSDSISPTSSSYVSSFDDNFFGDFT